MSAVVLVLLVVWGRFYYIDRLMLDSKLPFGMGKNPPSITMVFDHSVFLLRILFTVRTDKNNQRYQLCMLHYRQTYFIYFSVSFLLAEQHLHKAPHRINMAETDSLLRYNDRRIHYIGVHSKNSEKTYIYRAC